MLKATSVLPLICMLSVYSYGQASNMISISALREESHVASAYSRPQIEKLTRTAHTAEDFGHLADYFDSQAEIYAARYEEEQKELDRLLALHYHARSYPAQLENTRNRAASFKALSYKSSEKATFYRGRANAESTTPANASQLSY
jgi:hypothetical protein